HGSDQSDERARDRQRPDGARHIASGHRCGRPQGQPGREADCAFQIGNDVGRFGKLWGHRLVTVLPDGTSNEAISALSPKCLRVAAHASGTGQDFRTLSPGASEEFQMRFLGRLFPSFDGTPHYTSPYFYIPPKKRWWPFLAGCALGGVVVL